MHRHRDSEKMLTIVKAWKPRNPLAILSLYAGMITEPSPPIDGRTRYLVRSKALGKGGHLLRSLYSSGDSG